jgi:hypothetical protein
MFDGYKTDRKNETVNITSKRDPNLMTENGALSHQGSNLAIFNIRLDIRLEFLISQIMMEFYTFSGVQLTRWSRGCNLRASLRTYTCHGSRSSSSIDRPAPWVHADVRGLVRNAEMRDLRIFIIFGWPKTQTLVRPIRGRQARFVHSVDPLADRA